MLLAPQQIQHLMPRQICRLEELERELLEVWEYSTAILRDIALMWGAPARPELRLTLRSSSAVCLPESVSHAVATPRCNALPAIDQTSSACPHTRP